MAIDDDIAFLERVPLLSVLGRDALRIVAIGAESLYIHTGNTLLREGEPADAGFVVQSGAFGASSEARPAESDAATFGPGMLLGELAMIAETRSPYTVTALAPSNVFRIPRTLFLKMLEGYPEAALRLRDHLAGRADAIARDIRAVRDALEETQQRR